jgi:outer membrane protein OmpA-like peptidoglycan-associated protein
MGKHSLTFIVLFLVNLFALNGQGPMVPENSGQQMYKDAIAQSKQLIQYGFDSPELYGKLANSYFFVSDYAQAANWYQKYDQHPESQLDWEFMIRYATSLKKLGRTDEANVLFDRFKAEHRLMEDDLAKSVDYLQIVSENAVRYTVADAGINSDAPEFNGFYTDEWYYYASAKKGGGKHAKDPVAGTRTMDIYKMPVAVRGRPAGRPIKLNNEINSDQHESSWVIAPQGNEAYFTRASIDPNANRPYHLKIFMAELDPQSGEWGNVTEVALNAPLHSNAYPTLSPDGTQLYFASDRPGGFGQMDLYVAERDADGQWTKIKNLGPKINTSEREAFPFISAKKELYFASDGHHGFGGYDVYYVDLTDEKELLLNVGMPVNSPSDDFAFSVDIESQKGLFTSNRNGNEDLFVHTEKITIRDYLRQEVKGFVSNQFTGVPMKGVDVLVYDKENELVASTTTDEYGNYDMSFNLRGGYTLKLEQDGMALADYTVSSRHEAYVANFDIPANGIDGFGETDRLANVSLPEGVDLENLFFGEVSSSLDEKSKEALVKVGKMLKEHPGLVINVGSTGNSVEKGSYEEWVLEKRGKKIQEFLEAQGVDGQRLSFVKKDIIPCEGADCPEQPGQDIRNVFLEFEDEEEDPE